MLSHTYFSGKTTSAHLVCKELGYDVLELNASDARSKKSLDQIVAELLGNKSLAGYVTGKFAQQYICVIENICKNMFVNVMKDICENIVLENGQTLL